MYVCIAESLCCSPKTITTPLISSVKVAQSCLTLRPHGLYSPWNSPSQNTRVGSLSILQGIFPNQREYPGLPHCTEILYQLSHKESLNWLYPNTKQKGFLKKIMGHRILSQVYTSFLSWPSETLLSPHKHNSSSRNLGFLVLVWRMKVSPSISQCIIFCRVASWCLLLPQLCHFFTGFQRASFLNLEPHLCSNSVVSKRKTQREEVRCLECQRLHTREKCGEEWKGER